MWETGTIKTLIMAHWGRKGWYGVSQLMVTKRVGSIILTNDSKLALSWTKNGCRQMMCFTGPAKFCCSIVKIPTTEGVNVSEGEQNKKQTPKTNIWSLRCAIRVTNLFCAWHYVVFHRSSGQRGVKRCLDKWQTPLPWCLALFTNTWSSPWNGRKDKEGVAEGRNKGGWAIWTSKGEKETGRWVMEETGVTVTAGRWREIGGSLGGGWLVLLLFNRLAVLSWLGPRTPVSVESPQSCHRRQTPL